MKNLLPLTAALLLSAPALAGTATGNITVTAQVVDSCTVTGAGGGTGSDTTADFGIYSPATGNLLGAGAGLNMSVNCSLGTLYTASLNSGLHYTGTSRRLEHTTTADTDYLTYSLGLLDANGLLNDTAGASLPYLGLGVDVPLVLRGTLPAGQNALVGNYQDTVVLTITY